jgi:probable F420-dependent oxidoreductase
MKFGFVLPRTINGNDLCSFAKKVEDLGFDSVWAPDHIVIPVNETRQYPYTKDGSFTASPDDPQLDVLVVLSYIASSTKRIKIGTSVIIVPYRNPILQAKMLSTLDVLSRGRVICGVGVGWFQQEFEALNAPYADRGNATDEYMEIFKILWSSSAPEFEGTHYSFKDIGFEPKPVQKSIPIWVGGHTKRAIRRTVKYGDAWHPTRQTPEYVSTMMNYMKDYCGEIERNSAEITISLKRTLHFTDIGIDLSDRAQSDAALISTTDKVVSDVKKCVELGIHQLTFDFQTNDVGNCMKIMEHFAEKVVPKI